MTKLPENSPDGLDTLLDKVLDEALASYTPVAQRIGFEERLQARLAAEANLPRRPMFSLPWVWATSGILATALVLAAIHHHLQRPGQSKSQPSSASEPMLAGTKGNKQETSPLHRYAAAPAKETGPVRRYQPVSAINLTGLRETGAPSHPAPEEPLTEQEKLLLLIVHKSDPEEMAMLNPEIRERQEAEGEAEFKEFVEQSIKGESE
jgi:hypothetical protein